MLENYGVLSTHNHHIPSFQVNRMPILWLKTHMKKCAAPSAAFGCLFVFWCLSSIGYQPYWPLFVFLQGDHFYLGFGVPAKPLVHERSSGASESDS